MRWLVTFLGVCLLTAAEPAPQSPTPDAAQETTPQTIVCLGDSLTAGYGLEEAQAWPALMQAMASADGRDWQVINAGVSGDTTQSARKRVAWALKAKPTVVVIALGGNDGLRGIEPRLMEGNLHAIIRQVRAAGARPVLAGMQIPTNFPVERREEFTAVFPRLAERENIALIPFLLAGVGGEAKLNQADRIHPNAAGQKLLAATVYFVLVPLLSTQPSAELTPQLTAQPARTAAP